jgi:hypothetical protein
VSVLIKNVPIKWAAEVAHVREVALLGTADLAFWKDRLLRENLLPAERDGQAQLLIVAADMKYFGIRFRELSFSVLVSPSQEGIGPDAAYLVRAFNSRRLFAFCERVFFSTPYYYGDVRVSASFPASIHLVEKAEIVFRAEMDANASGPGREPSHTGEAAWDGPVFLPERGRGKGRQGNVFFARIRGHTQTYPFLPARDSLMFTPSADSEVFQALKESHLVAKEWAVREDATHAKSKTYKGADVFPGVIHADTNDPAVAPGSGAMPG